MAEKSIEMWLRGILSRIMYKEFNKGCLQKKKPFKCTHSTTETNSLKVKGWKNITCK